MPSPPSPISPSFRTHVNAELQSRSRTAGLSYTQSNMRNTLVITVTAMLGFLAIVGSHYPVYGAWESSAKRGAGLTNCLGACFGLQAASPKAISSASSPRYSTGYPWSDAHFTAHRGSSSHSGPSEPHVVFVTGSSSSDSSDNLRFAHLSALKKPSSPAHDGKGTEPTMPPLTRESSSSGGSPPRPSHFSPPRSRYHAPGSTSGPHKRSSRVWERQRSSAFSLGPRRGDVKAGLTGPTLQARGGGVSKCFKGICGPKLEHDPWTPAAVVEAHKKQEVARKALYRAHKDFDAAVKEHATLARQAAKAADHVRKRPPKTEATTSKAPAPKSPASKKLAFKPPASHSPEGKKASAPYFWPGSAKKPAKSPSTASTPRTSSVAWLSSPPKTPSPIVSSAFSSRFHTPAGSRQASPERNRPGGLHIAEPSHFARKSSVHPGHQGKGKVPMKPSSTSSSSSNSPAHTSRRHR